MIDTIGSGIKRIFNLQRSRFFPMPDYDLSDPQRVKVRLLGKILDENYTKLLMTNTDLSLFDVIALDKVQKNTHFRTKNLIDSKGLNLSKAAGRIFLWPPVLPKQLMERLTTSGIGHLTKRITKRWRSLLSKNSARQAAVKLTIFSMKNCRIF